MARMKGNLLIVLPVALVAACGDQSPATPEAPDTELTEAVAEPIIEGVDDASYLAQAGGGDRFEIESSRAILAKTEDGAVKDFARKMVEAHTASTEKLKAAAAKANLNVTPPALTPEQDVTLKSIRSASAADATATYLQAQRKAHADALTLHRTYAEQGKTPALKTAAGEIAPVVEEHIQMLDKLPGA